MGFKVGDRVRMIRNTYGNRGKIGTLEKIDTSTMPYCVVFDDGRKEWCYGHEFKLLKEEKVMTFKVGDKVKVSNSWEGHDGEIGQIVGINIYNEFTHEVRFEDMGAECFREEELELVKAKQQFTKSDLKTGMGVVLRSGDKAHVLLDTLGGDVLRFPDISSWSSLDRIGEDLLSESGERHDIVEVYGTEWSFKYLTDRVFDEGCLFKREEPIPEPEPTKMTMKEINEHFGKPIEIVE